MVILAQVFACFFLTGLIWTIQLLHYPGFALVGSPGFADYHRFHSRRITFIVLPLMLLELATAAWLVSAGPPGPWWLNLGGVVLIWAATGMLSVPMHERLARGFDASAARRLEFTNWVRTALWTARSLLLAIWLYGVL